ncbi:hypothetical protein [Sphingomonas corticis]|jgi:hypothetical protein|uniref:hypothetical protein n=1 Tax=Sphingomonas corticis TaxID=2722791 RepID=UPI001ADD7FA3|nr:hypothetical protein [Sphingomonas corticis]
MAKRSSGIRLTKKQARIVLGMVARGDRNHDVAAWYGVNQGRIAEVKKGEYGTLDPAPEADLPPSGPPGVKGRRLRAAVRSAVALLAGGDAGSALTALNTACVDYDADER